MYITDYIEELTDDNNTTKENDNHFMEMVIVVSVSLIASAVTSMEGMVLVTSTALSPLVIGGILGATIPAFFLALCILSSLILVRDRDSTIEYLKKGLLPILACTVISGLVGVGIAALSGALFSVLGSGGMCANRSYSTTCRFRCNILYNNSSS